ncbi:hypothetical protein ACFX1R_001249 [Malus domestica]
MPWKQLLMLQRGCLETLTTKEWGFAMALVETRTCSSRSTNRQEMFLYRAKDFACFLLDRAHKLISQGDKHGGDSPYSLFEGVGLMAYRFFDMVERTFLGEFLAYEH